MHCVFPSSVVRLSWCAAAFSPAAAVSVAAAFAAGSAKVRKRRTLSISTLRTLRQKSEKKKKKKKEVVCNSDTQVSVKCLNSSFSYRYLRCWNVSN